MLKKINASALATRLQSLRPSKQTMLRRFKQGVIAAIAFGGLYVIAPPLWDAIFVSPQQRVEPLNRRINDLDKQINKASPTPSTTDLKEIATLEKGRIDSENTIRTSLFQAVGGLLVFVTLYISWRTLKANEAKQVAENFSKAVEQLGNDNIHTRLGGIFMLEQVARDAEKKYYWQVMEMLTSYVRERSPNPENAAKKHSAAVYKAIDAIKDDTTHEEKETPPLPIDIQAVMTVLARRKHSYGHPLERYQIDLHDSDLRRLQLPPNTQLNQANLARTNLQEAKLEAVNLQGTDLRQANLQETNLREANLQRASLANVNLQGADIGGANLQMADLLEAKLQGADLRRANLQEAVLVAANLQEASLSNARLQGAILVGANLQGAEFVGASLQRAKLWVARLQDANLLGANLQEADLIGANLEEASLESANLKEVKFKESSPATVAQFGAQEAIGLTWEQLDTAASYEGAILPDYLPLRQQPHTETARSENQATESVQAEGEVAATPPEKTQLAPPES